VFLFCEAFYPCPVGGVYCAVVTGGRWVVCCLGGCAEVGGDCLEGLFPVAATIGRLGWQIPETLCRLEYPGAFPIQDLGKGGNP
jgi:hypothetical protein